MTDLPVMAADFIRAIDEAVDRANLPECCDEEGFIYLHSDHFGRRARKFKGSCPKGHYFVIRVWAPPGKKWS